MSLDLVFLGLSLSSSWGNGHATTYRALLRGLAAEGHRSLFLERDVPWYARHRDLPDPGFCDFSLYGEPGDLDRWFGRMAAADAVIVGSYVPDGVELIDRLQARRLVFYDIDTPVTLEALETGVADYLARRQLPNLDLYLSFSGGAALDRLVALGAPRAEALWCSVDETAYRPLGGSCRWELGYLGTYSPDRQPALEALLVEPARRRPEMRFVVAGPQYPDDLAWPANVERIEHLPPAEHPEFYSRQRFTLNVTRAAMRRLGHSPSVRLFEAASCGTPTISDRWQGLEELFPGGAIRIADGPDDVLAALDLDHDEASSIGAAARRIVLAAHTGRARARELAALIETLPAAAEAMT
jgi:spore maturation protein CgeB